MVNYLHDKIFIGSTSVIMLIAGLFFGIYFANHLETVDFEILNLGLTFVTITLLLFMGSLVLEIKHGMKSQEMQPKQRRKK